MHVRHEDPDPEASNQIAATVLAHASATRSAPLLGEIRMLRRDLQPWPPPRPFAGWTSSSPPWPDTGRQLGEAALTIREMPIGSVGWIESRALRLDPEGREALIGRLAVSPAPRSIRTMRVERRNDGYYVERSEARFALTPARWNAKLIPIAGYLTPLPDRVRAAYAAIEAAADETSPEDPSFIERACRHGHGARLTAGEVRAVLGMRLSELLLLLHSPDY